MNVVGRQRLFARTASPWRRVLPGWLTSRLVMVATALLAATALDGGHVERFLRAVAVGDSGWYVVVSKLGYQTGEPSVTHAFLPGLPLVLRIVGTVIPNPVVAGLLISAIAGAIATTALWRLAAIELGDDGADRAIRFFLVAPFSVFLFVGYTEALFLAFAFTALLASRERRWMAAAVLGSCAVMTRITGLAIAAAIIVEWLAWRRRTGSRSTSWVLLAAPFVALGVHLAWLHQLTGRWDAYNAAQGRIWHAGTAAPWQGAINLIRGSVDPAPWGPFAVVAIGCVVLGLATTFVLGRRGRFADATLVGVSTLLVAGSANYAAAGRTSLLWWPVFAGYARLTATNGRLQSRVLRWCGGSTLIVAALLFLGTNVG